MSCRRSACTDVGPCRACGWRERFGVHLLVSLAQPQTADECHTRARPAYRSTFADKLPTRKSIIARAAKLTRAFALRGTRRRQRQHRIDRRRITRGAQLLGDVLIA